MAFSRQQQLRERLAHHVGAADHDRLQALQGGVHALGETDAAERRAGHEARQAGREPADIHRIEAVDILVGIERREHFLRVDLRRQRQLHQDAVARPDRR